MTHFSRLIAALAVVTLQGCAMMADPRANQRSDAMYAQVQPGMTKEQVMVITGPPDNRMPFPRTQTDSWGWYYHDQWGYYCEQSVTFGPDGRVISKLSRRLNDGGGEKG
jgi:outer membrane protein assembly factor BamE (lipoprotein component of BamABCDE complex)